ncbi:MAG: hypothetical protein J6L69_03545 [Lachnospiraceae bacterium]|nr:hypothetical protein [Lachnospiraceae bacterium]
MKKRMILSAIACVGLLVFFGSIKVINMQRNKKVEEIKVSGFKIDDYLTGKDATVEEYMKAAKLDLDEVNGITIGVPVNGKIKKYYIDDATVVEDIKEYVRDIEIKGINSERVREKYKKGNSWDLQFYSDAEYGFAINAHKTSDEGVFFTWVYVGYDENIDMLYYKMKDGKRVEWFIDEYTESYAGQIIMDDNIESYIRKIYEENVRHINKDDIKKLFDKGQIELEDIFKYEYDYVRDSSIPEYVFDDGREEMLYTKIYHFKLSDSKSYLQVERGGYVIDNSTEEDGYLKPTFGYDIVNVQLVNGEGEIIDFYDITKEELEEFLE